MRAGRGKESSPAVRHSSFALRHFHDTTLLTTAAAFIDRLAVKPQEDDATKTRKAAMVAEFVTHLQADVKANRDEQTAREKSCERGVGSTGSIRLLLQEANQIVITQDAIMHINYTRVPDKLRVWKSASHIERAPQREKKPGPPQPTPPTNP